MIIRTETEQDYGPVRDLHFAAFSNSEEESRIVEKARASESFVPELSIVAEIDGEIAGHALFSEAEVVHDSGRAAVAVLGPIGVMPGRQKAGIGGRLIAEGLRRCRELGYDLVLLIGHPSYYPKFGFRPARPHGLELKQFNVPDEVFMVCEAAEGALGRVKGELRYPPAFF